MGAVESVNIHGDGKGVSPPGDDGISAMTALALFSNDF